jgi:hypothetical protein
VPRQGGGKLEIGKQAHGRRRPHTPERFERSRLVPPRNGRPHISRLAIAIGVLAYCAAAWALALWGWMAFLRLWD